MIYQEMTTSEMISDLLKDDYASWTYNQAVVLVEHLEDISDESEWRWDCVALRCEWSGYDSLEEAEKSYNLDKDENLEDYTTVLYADDGEVMIIDF